MIDRKWIGHALPTSVLPIERSRLQFFAKAIGETDPIYTDVDAARAAGYADLPAPPTFLFAAELDSGATDRLLVDLEIPIARLLHGEQRFTYHGTACAGDTVTVTSTISDIYERKNGRLEFVVKTAVAVDQRDALLAELELDPGLSPSTETTRVRDRTPTFDSVTIGDALPALQLPPVDRTMLALFAGASGDHNPIHIDVDVARRAGLPDVFAQGMLGMAWLGRLLTGWAPQSRLRRFDVRFQGITHLGHAMRCGGRIVEKLEDGGERCVRIVLQSENQYGQSRIVGEALVALP